MTVQFKCQMESHHQCLLAKVLFRGSEWWFDRQDSAGGDEVDVETDETLFVKQKYDRGRQL